MNRRVVLTLSILLCITAVVLASEKEKEKKLRETYSAVAMAVAGRPGGQTTSLTITIDSYTSDEETQRLAQTLRDDGSDALVEALDKLETGRVSPAGRIGHTLNFARTRPTETGRRILLASARPMTFFELRRGTRSRDYPIGIIQLDLDAKGNGQGALIVAARVKFNQENQLEVERYGIEPVRLVNVRRLK